MIDNNPDTLSLALNGPNVIQLRESGEILAHMVGMYWWSLDNNPEAVQIAAGQSELVQLDENGDVWRFTNSSCQGWGVCRDGWVMIGKGYTTGVAVGDGPDQVYRLTQQNFYDAESDSSTTRTSIYAYNGESCFFINGGDYARCPDWHLLDLNAGQTIRIMAAGNELYKLHKSGDIWRYTGQSCASATNDDFYCDSWEGTWELLDNSGATGGFVSDGVELYRMYTPPISMKTRRTCDDCAW
jgi:hypothetical protein